MIGMSKQKEESLSPTIEFIKKGDGINFPKKGFIVFIAYKGWVKFYFSF